MNAPRIWLLLLADVLAATALNLFASALMPPGSLFFDYRNPFSVYAVGTVALWTGLAGPRVGAWLALVFIGPLQLTMAAVNQIALPEIDEAKFATRSLWLATSFVITWLLVTGLRRGASALAYSSERAGRQAQRVTMLSELHDGALQTFAAIIRQGSAPSGAARARIAGVRHAALERATAVRATLRRERPERNDLIGRLRELVAQPDPSSFLDTRITVDGPVPALEPALAEALAGAASEALTNARRHSNGHHAVVQVGTVGPEVRVVVADDGGGFDPEAVDQERHGIKGSIHARLAVVGGNARLETAPGQGTRWELRAPLGRTPVDSLVERALLSLVIVPVSYRVLGLAISAAGLIGSASFGPVRLQGLIAAMAVAAVLNAGLIALLARPGPRRPGPGLVGIDIGLAIAMNCWAGATVPDGTVFLDYRDPFTLYAQGTLALWAGIKGGRIGLALFAAFALPLQLAMASLNAIPLGSVDAAKLVSRALWLIPALGIGYLVRWVARRGGALLAADVRRAGVEAETAEGLHVLYEGVVETLDRIVAACDEPVDDGATLRRVAANAHACEARLRATMRDGRPRSPGLYARLSRLVAEATVRDILSIELVLLDPEPRLATETVAAVVALLDEILCRAEATAPGGRVNVLAEPVPRGARLAVRAHDARWPLPDDNQAWTCALARVGGSLEVHSGEGATVATILVPSSELPQRGEFSPVAAGDARKSYR